MSDLPKNAPLASGVGIVHSADEETSAAMADMNSEALRSTLAAQIDQARRHCEASEFAAAERLCRRILDQAPGYLQALLLLGRILSTLGRHGEAIPALAALAAEFPHNGSVHSALGAALQAAGRHAAAVEPLRRAAELQPQAAAVRSNLGLALEKAGRPAEAIHAYENAVALDPDLLAARVNLGVALLNEGKPEGALAHLRRAAELNGAKAANNCLLGRALTALGNNDEALACYERAIAAEPRGLAGWLGKGETLRALGRFDAAAQSFEQALAIDPELSIARHALATMRREGEDAPEFDRLRAIVADAAASPENRGAAAMAMAKILDDCGRYDEAFSAASEGNRIARARSAASGRYDHALFRARHDVLMQTFTPAFFDRTRDWGAPSEAPVFIVGFFRTGSTLVEQICASHSQVAGLGESRDIPHIAAEVQKVAPSEWTAPFLRGLADRHIARLAALAPGKLRVVDKMLDNIFRLGLIAAMFPRARVIFTHRDGRDAALSAFMTHFGPEIGFATDLVDAGRRWRETERIGAHWRGCLPLRAHHVQYETLIADFETEARKLIDFLGLPWEPACLEFYKTERDIRTASVWQVRQPLSDASVGRWRHYANHLQDLCAAIGIDPAAPTGARPAGLA